MRYDVIINPQAGKGQAVKVWKNIEPIFNSSGWSTRVHVTEDTNKIIQELDDCDGIIAVGGDGTFHSVINSLIRLHRKIPLGLIPAGTGMEEYSDYDVRLKDELSKLHVAERIKEEAEAIKRARDEEEDTDSIIEKMLDTDDEPVVE